jgi:hypothetical protein
MYLQRHPERSEGPHKIRARHASVRGPSHPLRMTTLCNLSRRCRVAHDSIGKGGNRLSESKTTLIIHLMKSATEERRLKQLIRTAVNEALDQQKVFFEKAILEAIEEIGLIRAMEEAEDSPVVSREKIDRLLKRGR